MKQLLWHEPAAYRRAVYNQRERQDPLGSVRFAVFVFLAMLGFRWLAGTSTSPDVHPPAWGATLMVALAVALFVAYALPRFVGLFANNIVIVSEKGINHNTVWGGVSVRFMPWHAIAEVALYTDHVGGRAWPVLDIRGPDGALLDTVCVGKTVTVEQIQAALLANGRQLRRR